MFLKNADSTKNKTGSITLRLTLFYSLATFILISLIAIILYGTMIHILHRANYHFLSNEVNIISRLVRQTPLNYPLLEQKVIEVPYTETGSVYHYYIRILNDKNKILIETPNMSKVFANVGFFQYPTSSLEKKIDWWTSSNNFNYMLIDAPIAFEKSQNNWHIQIALDITYQQSMIIKYFWMLVLYLVGGTLLAILLGYFITRKGLRSLHELTEATKKITINSLHQQIDLESWPAELKNLGMAFNQMLARIEGSFAQLTRFSGDLAHELRTPVNNLMGQTEILLSRDCSVEEYQQVLASNLEELQRISQIIDNLLFLARTENIHSDIKKSSLNIEEEIKLVIEYYQAMADEKNIKMTCQGHAKLEANSVMFRRMISNLISNALKYTSIGGAVDIQVKESAAEVSIDIIDSGIGIANEHLPHIFNRFYRTDSARSQHSGGTGLGLAIVKSIIELHHGKISVSSKPNQGTVFHLIFSK